MRAIFLTLLLANLVFLAWANLIDVRPPPPDDTLGSLPRLELMSEARGLPPRGIAPADARAPATPAAPTATRAAAPAGGATPPAEVVTPAAGTHGTSQALAPGSVPVPVPRLRQPQGQRQGKVQDHAHGQAQSQAQARGRSQGQGYWVFIGGLQSQPQAEGVLRRLERSGISDAKVMRASDTQGARVSVGLFTRWTDAERRASAVRRAGLDAEIDVLRRGVMDSVARTASGERGGGASAPL